MPASAPPVIITSAAPLRMTSAASPTDCVDAAHAVVIVLLGPSAPKWRLTFAPAILGRIIGKKNGDIRIPPRSTRTRMLSSIVGKPPLPLPR